MPSTERVLASAADLVREVSRYSDVALSQPVAVTREGLPHNMLMPYAEYERLIGRDIQAFRAADRPDEFHDDLNQLAAANHRPCHPLDDFTAHGMGTFHYDGTV